MQKLVRRMTRFFVKTDKNETVAELDRVCEVLGYTCKRGSPGMVCTGKSQNSGISLVNLCFHKFPYSFTVKNKIFLVSALPQNKYQRLCYVFRYVHLNIMLESTNLGDLGKKL